MKILPVSYIDNKPPTIFEEFNIKYTKPLYLEQQTNTENNKPSFIKKTNLQNEKTKKVLKIAGIIAGLAIFAFFFRNKLTNLLPRMRSTNTPTVPPAQLITTVPTTPPPPPPITTAAASASVISASSVPKVSLQPEAVLPQKPEKLYHLTTAENYQSMLRDGIIKKSRVDDGVFMSDLADLKNKYPKTALERMIRWYGEPNPFGSHSPTGRVVLLELPIKQPEKLKFRQIGLQELPSVFSEQWIPFEDFGKIPEIHTRPLEYLYSSEIPISAARNVGEVQVNTLSEKNMLADFWKKIGL